MRIMSECVRCGHKGQVGAMTMECLDCLDWTTDDLRKKKNKAKGDNK